MTEHDTENCPGGADCPYSCPRKVFNRDDWELIETALNMAAHEYLQTYRELKGLGGEANRCARQRIRISKMLPGIRRRIQNAEGAES